MTDETVQARNRKRRVLFIAEAATLAHVARPYALAKGLDPENWDIHFACADPYLGLFPDWPWPREPIESISPRLFTARLAKGARLYSFDLLRQYAKEDLRVIERVRPDVVVGDFRLSLSASARVAGVPYVTVTNAYWGPYSRRARFPVPGLPIARVVGQSLASVLFRAGRPVAFAWHAVPLNRLRSAYGLRPLGLDLRRVYTDADVTLYADVPELAPTVGLPANHRHIGPVEWSPAMSIANLPTEDGRPLVYVTMGSSGSGELLPRIVEALAALDCRVAVATAGVRLENVSPGVLVADYLPGDRLSERASLVVCNGGSPTSYQALARGVPVLGMPFNLDQHLNMTGVQEFGAGLLLRPENASAGIIRTAARRLLSEPAFGSRAREVAAIVGSYATASLFSTALEAAMSLPSARSTTGRPR